MIDHPKVVVCIDFSEDSNFALMAAKDFCLKTKGKLHLIHVSDISIHWDWVSSATSTEYLESSYRLDLIKNLKKRLDNLTTDIPFEFENHILEGNPFQVIQQFIVEKKAHYMFLGKRGISKGIFAVGGLTVKMVSSSDIPVFVIKKNFFLNKIAGLVDPLGPIKNVVELTEELSYLFSTQASIFSLYKDLSARFIGFGRYGVATDLLVLTSDEKEKIASTLSNDIRKYLSKKSKVEVSIHFSSEKKSSYHLNNILLRENIDLVILHRHRKSFFEKIIIGSEARRLLEIFEGNLVFLPPP